MSLTTSHKLCSSQNIFPACHGQYTPSSAHFIIHASAVLEMFTLNYRLTFTFHFNQHKIETFHLFNLHFYKYLLVHTQGQENRQKALAEYFTRYSKDTTPAGILSFNLFFPPLPNGREEYSLLFPLSRIRLIALQDTF